MKLHLRPLTVLGAGLLSAALLAGCSSGGAPAGAESPASPLPAAGPATIRVGDKPTADRADELGLFEQRVEDFEAANPDITVEGVETAYNATTFQALVAGGELPTVLLVPFTEPQSLIQRNQIADMTDALAETGLADVLNPATLAVGQAEGRTYAVPIGAYSVGLVYNRELFEEAGLDPDAPPATWAELRQAAATIADKTDAAGFAQMSTDNTGGWMFTAETYSFGGSLQSEDGKSSTFAAQPAQDLLQTMHDMRWQDQSMGDQFLYNIDSIAQEFAAGRIGMYIAAPDTYNIAVSRFDLDADAFGVGPMPRGTDSEAYGTLSGGTVAVVRPDASPAEKVAAAKWIEFNHLEQFVDEEAAVESAKASAANDQAVGLPGLSPVSPEAYARWQGWIADEINVPVDNFRPYVDAAATQRIYPEPVNNAQQVYAALDTIIQTVLTEQSVDIPALLQEQATAVDRRLAR